MPDLFPSDLLVNDPPANNAAYTVPVTEKQQKTKKKAGTESTTKETDADDSTSQGKRKPLALPPELASLTGDDLDKIILAGSVDEATGETQDLVPSKIRMTNDKGEKSEWVIPFLRVQQWRRFAGNLGVKKYSDMKTGEPQRGIVALLTTGDLFSRCSIVNPKESKWILTANTHLRITNAVFHPEVFDMFSAMNDAKKRRDYELGNGPNNTKFYTDVSNLVYDTECCELDKLKLVYSSIATATEDPYVTAAIEQEGVNPKHPVKTDYRFVADIWGKCE
jgi:hypothetical protein